MIYFGTSHHTTDLHRTFKEQNWQLPDLKFINSNTLYTEDGKVFQQVSIDGFPAQCGILSLYDWYSPAIRNTAILLDRVEQVAEKLNYTKLVTTLAKSQASIQTVLIADGWRVVDEGVNRRSGNIICTLMKDIKLRNLPLYEYVNDEDDEDEE